MRKRVLGWTLALAGLTFLGGTLWASDDPGPTATLNFVIVKDYNGKPVHNAAVIMHSVSDKGKQEKGGLELKTDEDGKASYDGIPYGKLRVQVLAKGLQTYGQDYEVDQPTMSITIKLKRPEGQYSIYEDHPEEKKDVPKPPQ
ncbi:MAG TPA: carboxypeptidase-like regulatory domain-containing protein [Terriglobales bacterium]|jgi:hypothetical protein|nr:carboxypeptidase-like regulatory domain-containing protein [Terriglobales bacterium]